MIITTESLISECQNLNAICLNKVINSAYKKTTSQLIDLNLKLDINHRDVQKLLKNNLIIELCEFKKTISQYSVLFIKREEYNEDYLKIIDEISNKMELSRTEKSSNFIRNFNRYLKKSGLTYLSSVYLKQVSNKLALFR